MFTGLVGAVGEVTGREEGEGTLSLRVRCPELAGDLREGESVAVDGVCQTVVEADEDGFRFESVPVTLRKTTLGSMEPGRRVNLERSLAAGDRLGGHLVQGHVDGVGTVRSVEREGESVRVSIALPPEVARITVAGGSLAVDGASLTVQALRESVAEVVIIPYTWTHTALRRLRAGDEVNLEADLVGKYVAKLVAPYGGGESAGGAGSDRGEGTRSDDRTDE